MSKTSDGLRSAFSGESQANRKYLAFAKRAEEEGKPNLAKLFRAAAEGETVHAHNHLSVMGGINESKENLKEAISGETYEIDEMYPDFIKRAEEEGEDKAKVSFSGANSVEKVHQKLFKEALDRIEKGVDAEERTYFVCQTCGYPAIDDAPDKCPICGQPKEQFLRMP